MANGQWAFCGTCKKTVEFTTRTRQAQGERDGKSYRYRKQVAICPNCGTELDFAPYHQAAERAFEKACASDAGLITPEQIKELPRKYAIGKRPLSKLLGWGELTYTRLLDGNIPTPEHSAELLELLDDPVAFAQLLQRGYERGVITKTALDRSMRAIRDMVGNQADAVKKASAVADRLCVLAEGDLTPSALQSLLYYTHGYSMTMLDEPLFDIQPIAADRGPEYQLIRKGYSFNSIQSAYQDALNRASAEPNDEAVIEPTFAESDEGTSEVIAAEPNPIAQPDLAMPSDAISEEDVAALFAKAESAKEKKGKKSKKYKKALKAAMEAEALLHAQREAVAASGPLQAVEEETSDSASPEPLSIPGEQAPEEESGAERQVGEPPKPADELNDHAPTEPMPTPDSPLSGEEIAVIDRVYAQFGKLSGQALSAQARSELPWRTTRENAAESEANPTISRESMVEYFANLPRLAE